MDATQLWRVNVRTYLLWDDDSLIRGPIIDFALHSFYHAQYEIIRYLEMIEASAGIGCSNWEVYSNWRKTFSDFNKLPLGGFKCQHDSDPANLNAQNQNQWDFYHCTVGGDGPPSIRRGISGDVRVDFVTESTHGACAPVSRTELEAVSPRRAVAQAREAFHAPEKLWLQVRKKIPASFTTPALDDNDAPAPVVRRRTTSASRVYHRERSSSQYHTRHAKTSQGEQAPTPSSESLYVEHVNESRRAPELKAAQERMLRKVAELRGRWPGAAHST
jgi:hypothetical protein